MKVLFDTNVVLDLLLDRKPYVAAAAALIARVECKELTGYLGATTITTLSYIIAKTSGKKSADQHLRSLLELFAIAPVDRAVIEAALALNFADFEDAIICAAAKHSGADCIVTRNVKDFKRSKLPVYAPQALEATLQTTGG